MISRWNMRRRSLLAGSAAGLTLAGTGLLPRLAAAQPVHGGTLRVSVDQAPSVLNPLLHRVNPEYMGTFEVARDSRIVRVVNEAYRTVRGEDQPTGAIRPPGFYGTDAAHFHHRLGVEGIVCGPGGRYNTMPDERVDIPDYLDMEPSPVRVDVIPRLGLSLLRLAPGLVGAFAP